MCFYVRSYACNHGLIWYNFPIHQIEALKEIGVSEVVLAINYQPEVRIEVATVNILHTVYESIKW